MANDSSLIRRIAKFRPGARHAAIEIKLDQLARRLAEIDERDRSSTDGLRAGLERFRRDLMLEVDRTRSRLAVPDRHALELEAYRRTGTYAAVFDNPRPLVSITISTYNRGAVLVERSLASVLGQSYDNLQIIVVDDGSTDDTAERVRKVGDPRVVYARLSDHVLPPELSAGVEALNLGLAMARGDFVTHLDDDDEYVPDRIRDLVRFSQQERVEFVWHPFWWQETPDRDWAVNEAAEMAFAQVTTGSVFYIGWLKRFLWDPLAGLRYDQPDDWTLFRTLRDLGIVMKRHPETLLRHYKEGLNPRWGETQAGAASG